MILSGSNLAFADVQVLQPGQSTNIYGTTIVCDSGASRPKQAWMCGCFQPGGKNVGWVDIFANDKQEAMQTGAWECRRKFNDPTLDTIYAGCTPEGN